MRPAAARAVAKGTLLQRESRAAGRRHLLGILDEALLDDDGEAASQAAAARGLPP